MYRLLWYDRILHFAEHVFMFRTSLGINSDHFSK
jgi:hypothetical protein